MHREAIDVLPRILDAARVGRHALIGHSDGGTIAAIAAGARDDPALAGIVLIAAHFFVEDMNLSAIAAIQESYAQGDLRRRLGRYHDDPDAAFMGWSGAWLDPAFRSLDLSRYLAAIRAPVLGLQGADDPYGTEAQLEFLSAHTRVRTETRLIDGARHAPHLEAKNPTLAAITGFVLDLTP